MKANPQVAITSGEDVYSATVGALDLLGFSRNVEEEMVLIKPNLTNNSSPQSGIITSPESVRAILERISSSRIIIGEGSGDSSAKLVFKTQGYEELAREFDAELIDFDEGEVAEKVLTESFFKKRIPFAQSAVEADFIVSAAKLKTHSLAGVTLSMKNMFGTIPTRRNKLRFHGSIEKAIPDFMRVVKPDLCVLEAFPGNQGNEVISDPVASNIVIAGTDPLAVDIVGALCMDVNPDKVKHIQLMKEMEGREYLEIKVVGEEIEEVKRSYRGDKRLSTKVMHTLSRIITYV